MQRIALVTSDPWLVERLGAATAGRVATEVLRPGADLSQQILAAKPSAIVVDVQGDPGASAVRDVVELARSVAPGLEVIAIGEAANANLVIQALRAGSADFIDRAAGEGELRDQLLGRLLSARALDRGPAGEFTVVLGAQTNSAAGLFAVNLALLRAEHAGEGLYLDCTLPATEADAALDLPASYTLWEAVRDLERLDRTLLWSALPVHARSGLRLLPLARSAAEEVALSPESFLRAVRTIRSLFRETVLNLGAIRQPHILSALVGSAHRVFLVAPQTFTAVREAKALLGAIDDPSARERVTLVVEEHSPGISLTETQMRDTLGLASSVALPPARDELINSLNIGRPLVFDRPASPYSEKLRRLALNGHAAAEPRKVWDRMRERLPQRLRFPA